MLLLQDSGYRNWKKLQHSKGKSVFFFFTSISEIKADISAQDRSRTSRDSYRAFLSQIYVLLEIVFKRRYQCKLLYLFLDLWEFGERTWQSNDRKNFPPCSFSLSLCFYLMACSRKKNLLKWHFWDYENVFLT